MKKDKVIRARIADELLEEFKSNLTARYGRWEREMSRYLLWCIKNFPMLIEIKEGGILKDLKFLDQQFKVDDYLVDGRLHNVIRELLEKFEIKEGKK